MQRQKDRFGVRRVGDQSSSQQRMVKKQQMGWSPRGAHVLLQIRTRVLDDEWRTLSGAGIRLSALKASKPKKQPDPPESPALGTLASSQNLFQIVRYAHYPHSSMHVVDEYAQKW